MSLVNRKSGTSAGVILLCAAAMVTSSAVAQTMTTESVSVSYVAADLGTESGADALYRRIRRAAKLVCHEPDIRELAKYRNYRQCYDGAVDAAVAKVDATALTALHRRARGPAG
jgi:UrcA family protein